MGQGRPESTQERALHGLHPSRLRWPLLLLAVLLVSGIGATGFTHLMTLYMSEGMDAMRTAAAFSLRTGADGEGKVRLRRAVRQAGQLPGKLSAVRQLYPRLHAVRAGALKVRR